ncbi:MAG: hypothetical protein AAGE98_19730 [Actinomycetota bacterium]
MRTALTPRLLAVLLAAFALFLAACGSDTVEGETESSIDAGDDTADDSSADDATTDDTADDTADELPADDGDEAAMSGLSDDDAGDEATSEVVDAPSGGGDFCGLYADNQNLFSEIDIFDPAQVEEWAGMSRSLLDEAIAQAPGEIRDDLDIVRGDFDEVIGVLEVNGYDFLAAADDVDAISENPESEAASARIDEYVESVCGIDPDEAGEEFVEGFFDEDNIDSILGNETLFNTIIGGMTEDGELTEEQATCFLSNLDGEVISGLMADPTAAMSDPAALQDLLGTFETCGIPLG